MAVVKWWWWWWWWWSWWFRREDAASMLRQCNGERNSPRSLLKKLLWGKTSKTFFRVFTKDCAPNGLCSRCSGRNDDNRNIRFITFINDDELTDDASAIFVYSRRNEALDSKIGKLFQNNRFVFRMVLPMSLIWNGLVWTVCRRRE